MHELPPLNALRGFEAAARRLSFTLAAEELHVTPGAISRQIRGLEETLKHQLFIRGHRQITLTPQGQAYFNAISKAFADLRAASTQLMRQQERAKLKIRAYTTFSMRWLIPKLSTFHAENVGVEVLLTASLDPVDFDLEDIDGAIRLGSGNWPKVRSYPLMPNILMPVCSPALAQTVKRPADLARHTLLHSIARPDDWAIWLQQVKGVTSIDATSGMTYQSSAMAYAAALEGQGFALAQKFLVEDDLNKGNLVAPFKETVDMGNFTYYLITPRSRPERDSMRTFREWLLAQTAKRG